jgi:hypothetical protein
MPAVAASSAGPLLLTIILDAEPDADVEEEAPAVQPTHHFSH